MTSFVGHPSGDYSQGFLGQRSASVRRLVDMSNSVRLDESFDLQAGRDLRAVLRVAGMLAVALPSKSFEHPAQHLPGIYQAYFDYFLRWRASDTEYLVPYKVSPIKICIYIY